MKYWNEKCVVSKKTIFLKNSCTNILKKEKKLKRIQMAIVMNNICVDIY